MPPDDATIDTLLQRAPATAMSPALRAQVEAASTHLPAQAIAPLAATFDLLAQLGADGDVAAATLLHAIPELPTAQAAVIEKQHPAVALLLEGQRAAAQVWALHAEHGGGNPEGLRRLLLAIVRDLRVVPVLLARQLVAMRGAHALPADERRALARLTRDIHAPLANRLGIWQLKWELEDLAFRHLEPETYQRIAQGLPDLLDVAFAADALVVEQARDALAAQGIASDVAGRPKHIYSIWKKMQKKNAPISELYDLRAVRVLVEDLPACYAALGVVHALWLPLPSEFDDYIARPKRNDYRSLHTAVIGPEGKTLEVQIRTHDMHRQAELGVAAHWRYKEQAYKGGSKGDVRSATGDAAVDRKIEWMRRLLDTHVDGAGDGGGLREALDTELVEDRIYALTPRGEVIDLPQGATPLDFAYHVHTEVGHRCRGAKVDGRIVPLDHRLHSGDRVEIMTAKVSEPRRDWLLASNGFLASARSREKVRTWFNRLDRARNIHDGRDLLERDLRRLGLLQADLSPVLQKFNAAGIDDLYVLVALGDVGPQQVARALLERDRAEPATDIAPPTGPRPPRKTGGKGKATGFTVVGIGNLLMQIARCCQPLPGEPIAGYLTRARGVTVHRADCAAYLRLAAQHPQRTMPVEWGSVGGGHEVDVVVQAVDRKWLLKDLTTLIAQEDAHVLDIHGSSTRAGGSRGGRVQFRMRLRVQDFGQLTRLLGKAESLPGVEAARRA